MTPQDTIVLSRVGADVGFAERVWFDAIFENAPVPMARVAPDGSFDRVNYAFAALTGYSPAELEDRTFQQITHPDDLEADVEMVEQLLAGSRMQYAMVKRYLTKNSNVVGVHLHVRAIREVLPDGKLDPNITCFVVHAVPLPNHGKFKIVDKDPTDLHVRPVVTFGDLLRDNRKWLIGLAVPAIPTGGLFILKLYHVFQELLEKTGVSW